MEHTKLTVRMDRRLRERAHLAIKDLEGSTLSEFVLEQLQDLVAEYERKNNLAPYNFGDEPNLPVRKIEPEVDIWSTVELGL